MKRFLLLAVTIHILCFLCSCSSQNPPVAPSPDVDESASESPGSHSSYLERLRLQIDPYKDEYLYDYLLNEYEGDCLGLLTVDYYAPCCFRNITGKWETFVVYSVETLFHSAGFDRKIAAVYDSETGEILAQKSFGRDSGSFFLLNDYPGADAEHYYDRYDRQTSANILFIGSSVYGGMYEYEIGFYTIFDGEWVLIPLPLPFEYSANNSSKAFAFSCDTLFYFDIEQSAESAEPLPAYSLTNAFAWRDGIFVELYHNRSVVGTIDNVVIDYGSSARFSEAEIESAVDAVLAKFIDFSGCDLRRIWYNESRSELFISELFISGASWEPKNIIVLLSDFYVDESGANEGFNPDSLYSEWNWILVRDSSDSSWSVWNWGY